MSDEKRIPTKEGTRDARCAVPVANRPSDCEPGIRCEGCVQAPKWRADFPIEWEGDQYVSRRELVKFLTLGSGLLTAASWATVAASHVLHRGSKGERYIGSAAMLEREGSLLFRYPSDEDPCIAVKTADGKLVAYSQVCTHLSCAVVYDKKENNLLCPCHNGKFNLDRGAPVAGPPTRPLARVKIEQRGDKLFATELEADERADNERPVDTREA
ncbi:MAG TPA: Rieske 2Fe-2S domain-containing protein [Candidatus Acidoferrales bacterium]|nr:Rieske 2Fe-2S domain-containing protein [Candidatus Acidoferrales bacterium]